MPARVPLSDAGGCSSSESPSSSSIVAPSASSLLSSICINQASPSALLEEEEDIMPGLGNSGRKQLKTKTGDFAMVRWSKPLGDYIMNFYRPKEVLCKKTESGGHTRLP